MAFSFRNSSSSGLIGLLPIPPYEYSIHLMELPGRFAKITVRQKSVLLQRKPTNPLRTEGDQRSGWFPSLLL
jgi:hypothetical protein